MLTIEEKKVRVEARRKARRLEQEKLEIEAEKAQKLVKSLTITIEWRKSRMWGNKPHAEAQVSFKDGTFERANGFTCSGCGYDKESTVIADIFNKYLKYKLYQKHQWKTRINSNEKINYPYGVNYYNGDVGKTYENGYISTPCYNGGVGTSCYYRIGEFIGGRFENIASGKTFDVYKYTD